MTRAFLLTALVACATARAEEPAVAPAQTPFALTRVLASSASNRLLVVPKTKTHPMIAIVEDKGDHAEIIRVEKLGGTGESHSHFISADGSIFGAATSGIGASAQQMNLFHSNNTEREVFPAFGQLGDGERRFAVSDDGAYVICPGTLGAVCWKRRGDEWVEAWAIDYWKTSTITDWPQFAENESSPAFNAMIPFGADFAWITFSQTVTAVNLKDGKERLNFSAPPTLGGVLKGDRLYVAGQDGTLQRLTTSGQRVWMLDCNASLLRAHTSATNADQDFGGAVLRVQASRAPTTSRVVPKGENLLRNGKAVLKLFSTTDWKTMRAAELNSAELTNGKFDDVETPWIKTGHEALAHAVAEIEFKEPTDVRALTVYEHAQHPEAWPSTGFVQVWDDASKAWRTVARGFFLVAPTNTYVLDLKAVKRLRYIPWNYPARSLYTCEIEVR